MNRTIAMRFPNGRAKTLTFSYDDGVEQDMRLAELLEAHGMKGTFNLNGGLYAPEGYVHRSNHRRMSKQQVTDFFSTREHEIATHAFTHPPLDTLPVSAVCYEIMRDRETLEEQFGRVIRGHAYPYGTTADHVVDALRACGILYARTTVSTERFSLPEDWLRLPATCHHNNPRLMELAKGFVERDFRFNPGMFYLWGHSYEFDNDNNWHVIEEFLDYMAGREDQIWYATNGEIFEYMEDYRRLIFSADCSMIYNPTARTLWFLHQKEIHSIAPRETIHLS
ncbi:MAG: polysaccharide deacetylase family protein [Clostridia bacterium]|nr:polysaccharide deacetylase family protein [Clostridia bacterium]